jgi:hypothetical protein
MPSVNEGDFPLQILLEVAKSSDQEKVTASLLKDLYEVQKQHQFDEEPAIALVKMRKRVESELDATDSNEGAQ